MSKLKSMATKIFPQSWSALQKVLFCSIYLLFFLYSLSIPAISSRYPLNYVSIVICGLMCILILIYIIKYSKFYFDFFIFIILLFNFSIFLTHLVNFNFTSFPKTIALMSLVGIMLYEFLKTHNHKNIILYALLAAGVVFSLIYLVYYKDEIFNFSNIFDQRLGSYFDNENEIGKEFAFFAVISLTISIKTRKVWNKLIFIVLYLVFVFLILSTGSISNLLTILLVTILSLIICQKSFKGKIIASIVAISIIVTFILVIQIPQFAYFKKRIDQIINVFITNSSDPKDGSASNRWDAAITSFVVGSNRLILGFGYMSASSYTIQAIQSHNNFAELFIDFGLAGLFIFELILIIPILFSKKDDKKIFAVTITLEMFIFQFFLTTYYKKIEYIFIAYLFSIFNQLSEDIFVSPEKAFLFTENKTLFDRKKKTILEIIPAFTPVGGAETFVYNFCKEIQRNHSNDVNLIVVSLYRRNACRIINDLKSKNIIVVELEKKRGFDIICTIKLHLLLRKTKPCVIHTHLASLLTVRFALLFRRKRPKIVHTIHQNFPIKPSISDKFEWHLIRTNFITPVCVAKKPSKEYSKKLNTKIPYINNGVDISLYDNKKPLYRRKIDFLVVGRFVPVKNHMYLLRIFKDYGEQLKYKCVFLGDGPLLEGCKTYVAENNMQNKITFAGTVTNVNEYMANSKVLLMPSINEGNPMVINEAFASGMAVIGNKVGGISDLLKNKEFSQLVSPNKPKTFYAKMNELLLTINDSKIKSIQYSNHEFSIDLTIDSYFKLFFDSKNSLREEVKI